MKICIPVLEDLGLASPLSDHFGSAPIFVIASTDDRTLRIIPNDNQHHGHGMCQPLAMLGNEEIDALVTAGIGAGALSKLHAAGIRVFRPAGRSIDAILDEYANGGLQEITLQSTCGGHHGCGGHH